MTENKIICGDCLQLVPTLPRPTMIFADPPDNINLAYHGYNDNRPVSEYLQWLASVMCTATRHTRIFWFSINHQWMDDVAAQLIDWYQRALTADQQWKWFMWYFTFGQHNHNDCGNNYRPILRWCNGDPPLYPDHIRVESERQRSGDKRADPRGRVPGDVWEFPRVVGNAKERRPWHSTQHPEALIERILKFSCMPGDSVIDMFAGTGTVHRVAKRLGINSYSIDICPTYCDAILAEDT